jgi:acyl carrier protein
MSDELDGLKLQVRRLITIAAGGRIHDDDLVDDADLRQIGLDSLGYLNLLEGLERTFGVTIDLDQERDHTFLHTGNNLTRFLMTRRGKAA